MLITTQYKNGTVNYYSYETEYQKTKALLAIIKNGWKYFPKNTTLDDNRESVRHHFTVAEWEMATLKDMVYEALPPMMKAKVATVKATFSSLMEEQTRQVKTINAARRIIQASKEDALKMRVKVKGELKPSILVIAAELDEFLYRKYEMHLYSEQKTEDY